MPESSFNKGGRKIHYCPPYKRGKQGVVINPLFLKEIYIINSP